MTQCLRIAYLYNICKEEIVANFNFSTIYIYILELFRQCGIFFYLHFIRYISLYIFIFHKVPHTVVVMITDITQNITALGSHMDDFPIKAQVRNNYRQLYTHIKSILPQKMLLVTFVLRGYKRKKYSYIKDI